MSYGWFIYSLFAITQAVWWVSLSTIERLEEDKLMGNIPHSKWEIFKIIVFFVMLSPITSLCIILEIIDLINKKRSRGGSPYVKSYQIT